MAIPACLPGEFEDLETAAVDVAVAVTVSLAEVLGINEELETLADVIDTVEDEVGIDVVEDEVVVNVINVDEALEVLVLVVAAVSIEHCPSLTHS